MPETATRTRRCRDCDGFPTVVITTGRTAFDGTRQTIKVTCRTCHGTGTAPAGTREAARV
ncbi:hypothetical protein OG727_18185 [Streptomyces caniferus]|uniref:Molecular chaperone DnaJ n=1 Tax=Streptomyces caniferus TaxID=285557 RepID=A0ABZ1VME6_9ACTN|nr:hypothetical protein [Streptomyces caniferus]